MEGVDENTENSIGFIRRAYLTLEGAVVLVVASAVVGAVVFAYSWLIEKMPLPALVLLAVAAFGLTLCTSLLWRAWRNPTSMKVVPPFTPTSPDGVHGDPKLGRGGLVELEHFREAKTITGLQFRLIDLLDADDMNHRAIKGKTFVNCTIVGPSCVALGNNVAMRNVKIHGHREAMVTLYKRSNVVLGAIGIEDCIFRDCTFVRISFVGKQPTIDKWMKEWGWSKPRK